VSGMIAKPNAGTVYWIEVNPRGERLSPECRTVTGRAADREVHLAREVQRHPNLRHNDCARLIRFICAAVRRETADEMQLGSPFRLREFHPALTCPTRHPDRPAGFQAGARPRADRYRPSHRRRMLALFTSYAA